VSSRARTLQKRILNSTKVTVRRERDGQTVGSCVPFSPAHASYEVVDGVRVPVIKADWKPTAPESARVHRKRQKRKGSLRGVRRGTFKPRSGAVDLGAPVRDPADRAEGHRVKMERKANRNKTMIAGYFRWPVSQEAN
jgi:hypothetical protein